MSSSPEAYHGYVRLLERFLGANLSDPSVQIEIARQQLSGTFEWFYGEEIPPEILRQASAHHELQFEIPRRLNEVAKRILAINENMPTRPEDSPEAQGRTVVRFSDHGDLLSKARQVYRHLTNEEETGIGGANFLLACSIERQRSRERQYRSVESSNRFNEITLIDETILGIERSGPGDRPNDFLDHLRSRKLVVKAVVGEPRSSDASCENGQEE